MLLCLRVSENQMVEFVKRALVRACDSYLSVNAVMFSNVKEVRN